MDPFDDALDSLRLLIVSSQSIATSLQSKGILIPEKLDELKGLLQEGELDLQTLQKIVRDAKQLVFVVPEGPRAAERLGSASLWVERDQAVQDVERDFLELKRIYQRMESKRMSAKKPPPSLLPQSTSSIRRENDDEFLEIHREQELEELEAQDQVMDRLQGGLHRLRDNATTARETLIVQESMLDKTQIAIDEVRVRMAAANERVDHLLANMSNCNKICLIVTLLLVLIGLLMTLF